MSNPYNYAENFREFLAQKYAKELTSSDLTDQDIKFIGAKTVNIPVASMSGYKNHSRAGGFEKGAAGITWEPKLLARDRSIEFFVDAMDVDETNQAAAAAKLTTVFEEEQAIPELDAYRYSKLFALYYAADSSAVDTDLLTVKNVLLKFDGYMAAMDDKGVPSDGRIVYVTPTVNSLIKNAVGIYRTFGVQSGAGQVDRAVSSLDNVKIVVVPSGRFMTAYEFDNGFEPASGAKQINMILLHPSAVIAVDKHNAINLWPPGTHTQGDGYLYQNRVYGDLFILNQKIDGIKINASTDAVQPPAPPDVVAYTVSANGTSGISPTTQITVTFGEKVAGLKAENFELETTEANTIAITGATTADEGFTWVLAVTVAVADNAKDVTVEVVDVDDYEFVAVNKVVKVYQQN